jgi:hypothetical protein
MKINLFLKIMVCTSLITTKLLDEASNIAPFTTSSRFFVYPCVKNWNAFDALSGVFRIPKFYS